MKKILPILVLLAGCQTMTDAEIDAWFEARSETVAQDCTAAYEEIGRNRSKQCACLGRWLNAAHRDYLADVEAVGGVRWDIEMNMKGGSLPYEPPGCERFALPILDYMKN